MFIKMYYKASLWKWWKDVFLTSLNDPNFSVIIEKFLEQEEHFIIQKFINGCF